MEFADFLHAVPAVQLLPDGSRKTWFVLCEWAGDSTQEGVWEYLGVPEGAWEGEQPTVLAVGADAFDALGLLDPVSERKMVAEDVPIFPVEEQQSLGAILKALQDVLASPTIQVGDITVRVSLTVIIGGKPN